MKAILCTDFKVYVQSFIAYSTVIKIHISMAVIGTISRHQFLLRRALQQVRQSVSLLVFFCVFGTVFYVVFKLHLMCIYAVLFKSFI